jgi:N-acetylglutamate synthase-like GNAT family acetyltransferase
MRFEAYSKKKHGAHILNWLKHYQLSSELDELPKIGFVAMDNEPIACCFLNIMECASAMIDGLMVKPEIRNRKRHDALNGVVHCILIKAQDLKIKRVLAYTTDISTLWRSQKFGFMRQPHTFIALDLRSGS